MYVSGLLALTLSLAITRPAAAAQAVGPCQSYQVCRFANPEDLADLTGTDWVLVSEQSGAVQGGIVAFDTRANVLAPLNAADAPTDTAHQDGDPACQRAARLHNGGMDLLPAADGYRLAVVNHAEPDRIDFFRVAVAGGAPVLHWSGCAQAPPDYFLNDVALLPDGVAATHMFDRKMDKAQRDARLLKSEPTGFIVRWTQGAGWARIPNTEASFPNGVVAAPDGSWIAFAETYGHVVDRISQDGADRKRIAVAMQPDNLTLAGGDTVIVAGGTGAPMVSTQNCPALRKVGCGFPAAALSLDLKTGESRRLLTSGGVAMPGPSVALVKDGTLYLGTSYGDRVTRVRPPAVLP